MKTQSLSRQEDGDPNRVKAEKSNPYDFEAHWDFENPEQTEITFHNFLNTPSVEDPVYRAELLTQIARTQGLQRKFDEAHRTLDEAQALITPEMGRARIRYLIERGRVFNSSQRPAEARPLFLEALALAQADEEDFYAIDAAHMMGIIEPPEQQLEWTARALELAEKSEDLRARKWLGSLYNNLGWSYHDLGRYAEALEIFQKALAWREADGLEREIRIARWSVARTLRSLGRVEEALERQRDLLKQYQKAGETSGFVHEELGECLLLLGQNAEAREHFALAHVELAKDPWLAENEPARLERLKELGNG